MGKKYLIVGGVAGGASTAARLRRLSEDDQIIMFEKGPHVSFSNCSLPYYLSGTVKKIDDLLMMTPEKFIHQYNIEARINNEVINIDRDRKEVEVRDGNNGSTYRESYDKLVLSPGAVPIVPKIPGIEKIRPFTLRNVTDIDQLKKYVDHIKPTRITVIGGGFIGIECAENFVTAGYQVSLVEAQTQILTQFDDEMVQILHKEMYDQGLDLHIDDKVIGFDTNQVFLESGSRINSEVIVLAIGVRPDTELAKKAGLTIGKTNGIKVNQNYRTNDVDIYAVGDAIETYNPLTQDCFILALAGPAQKQARSVADHIHAIPIRNTGYIGSSVVQVFNYSAAATGLNESQLAKMNIEYDYVEIIPKDKVGIMPDAEEVHFKLLFEKPTGRVLGAQAIGRGDIVKRIDVIATAIKFRATIQHLRDLELCYAPPFGTAKDVVNFAGYVASNLLNDNFQQIKMSQLRSLTENGAYILDVRENNEWDEGHVLNAHHIPLSALRVRMNEIPQDQPVYIYCRSGQRSYNAVLALQYSGYHNVYNISGGFMGICFYEYFTDQTCNRKPIVSAYNFN